MIGSFPEAFVVQTEFKTLAKLPVACSIVSKPKIDRVQELPVLSDQLFDSFVDELKLSGSARDDDAKLLKLAMIQKFQLVAKPDVRGFRTIPLSASSVLLRRWSSLSIGPRR